MASDIRLAVGDGSRRSAGSDPARDPAIRALEHAVEGLCQQLDRAAQQVAEAQAAERKAIELVKYVTTEAGDLRKRADDALTAERLARDEAAGLRAELDARRQWGLRRRLRWAPGRRR